MPEYEVKGKARWLLENDPQLVLFPKESWEYIKEKFNPGGEYDNKNERQGYLMFPEFIALELYQEVDTIKKKLPRKVPTQILCHRCHLPVKKGRWVAPMTVMCFPCIKIMRKEDEAYWKEQQRKEKLKKQIAAGKIPKHECGSVWDDNCDICGRKFVGPHGEEIPK